MRDNEAVVLVSKTEWERFVAVVEELVDVHTQLLKRVRELKMRHNTVKEQLRNALGSQTVQTSQRIVSGIDNVLVQLAQVESRSTPSVFCIHCGRMLLQTDVYCDLCGHRIER